MILLIIKLFNVCVGQETETIFYDELVDVSDESEEASEADNTSADENNIVTNIDNIINKNKLVSLTVGCSGFNSTWHLCLTVSLILLLHCPCVPLLQSRW